MYCKDCQFRMQDNECVNVHLTEMPERFAQLQEGGNRLVYGYVEDGGFYVEDYFGCVHFKARDSINIEKVAVTEEEER